MFDEIAREIEHAKANRSKAVTIHFQILVHADRLRNVDPEQFCEGVGIEPSWAMEFRKIINLAKLRDERGYVIEKK